MKKILITVAFLALSIGATAQQDNTDELQQQAPRETQKEVERAAAVDAKKQEADKKAKEAEEAKRKEEEARQKEAALEKEKQEKAKAKSQKK